MPIYKVTSVVNVEKTMEVYVSTDSEESVDNLFFDMTLDPMMKTVSEEETDAYIEHIVEITEVPEGDFVFVEDVE